MKPASRPDRFARQVSEAFRRQPASPGNKRLRRIDAALAVIHQAMLSTVLIVGFVIWEAGSDSWYLL